MNEKSVGQLMRFKGMDVRYKDALTKIRIEQEMDVNVIVIKGIFLERWKDSLLSDAQYLIYSPIILLCIYRLWQIAIYYWKKEQLPAWCKYPKEMEQRILAKNFFRVWVVIMAGLKMLNVIYLDWWLVVEPLWLVVCYEYWLELKLYWQKT